ncbi:MAG: hypothetical protein ACYCVD_15045 [Desulfitobacteriaceae bacterium]
MAAKAGATATRPRLSADLSGRRGTFVAGLIVLCLAILVLGSFKVLSQSQSRIKLLEKEKGRWQEALVSFRNQGGETVIPKLEQLPDIIETCRMAFQAQGVKVKALNVERFAQEKGNVFGAKLDYVLLRMHWSGSRQGIESALAGLEEAPDLAVLVQEISLKKDGGEGLLQIYFRT